MRIALFGGSFDPPHLGHLMVANVVEQQKIANEVWFVPCANHAFSKSMSPAKNRLDMLKLLSNKKHPIYTYELEKTTPSYSLETLKHAVQKFPQHSFVWLIGSDQVGVFHKWHRYKELLKKFTVLVYPREHHPVDVLLPGMQAVKDCPIISVSSTEVRNTVHNHQPIEKFVTKEIAEYIEENRLYV